VKGSSTATNTKRNPFVKVEKSAEPTTTAPPTVHVTKAPRGAASRAFRACRWAAVMLLLVAGAWQVIGRPIAAAVNSSPPPAATTTVSDDQARTTAVVAVTDWLTYNPQTLSAYRSIAGARFGAGAAASAWSGSAWMAPDVVTAGTVVTQPDGDLVTQVTARVRIATPAQPSNTPSPPQSTSGDPGNDPTVPAGWTVVSTQWLHLLVPITGQGRPEPAGPVLATANEARTTEATGSTDSAATASSQPWAASLFTALAGTDPTALGYLTTNPLIIPLGGQVEFNGLTTWQVTDQAEGDTGTTRQGTGTVSWKFPGIDLTVKQTYTVEAEQTGGRWFATTITPTTAGGTA
jgi:hypothetical protein